MTRVSTPFGFHSTAEEVARGIDLSGKRAIVTGAASGIGVETARALAGTGAAVTLAVRNPDAGERVAAEIAETTGNRNVQVAQLDLADQEIGRRIRRRVGRSAARARRQRRRHGVARAAAHA